ncbi:uncharacterized protein LOC135681808 [Rhopilema esculentum]|uniref:uncharacterized protein LOC135681808 n=1 Tax=Rhopilema esculentum TaxID=499914 RepID=UPI0031DD6ACD
MPQEDMPIPVWVECVDDDGNVTVTAAEISLPPHGAARCLDNTASLMEKQAPRPIGMESREFPNAQITASSEQGPYYKAHEARLNNKPKGKIIGAWCPKNHDDCQWLQIDMGKERNVQQIGTQGMPLLSVRRPKDRRWVESYVFSYSSDGLKWKYYEDENNNPKIFIANVDLENTAKNSFVSGLKTRYLRIHPTSWSTGIALRVEIYVEKETKGKEVETRDSVSLSEAVTKSLYSDDDRESCSEKHSSEESDSGSEYILHDHLDDEEDDICNADEAKNLSNSLNSAAYVEEGERFSQASNVKGVASDGFRTRLSSFRESAQSASFETNNIKEVLASNEESISESPRHTKSTIGSKIRIEEFLSQQRPGDRRRLTFRAIVGRLMSIPNISTGLTLDAEEEKDEFLSKYCILKDSQKILFSRVFQKLDHDCDGLIEKEQLMGGLAALNLNSLRDAEMNYIMELIDVFDETIKEGIDQKTFNVIAAFADRLKRVDAFTRGMIRDTNFATLYLHAHKTRDLFEKMLDKGETTISSEQFLIELEAGGVKSEAQNLVRTYTDEKKHLDFLDFAIYFPLFLHTHEQIMSTPL